MHQQLLIATLFLVTPGLCQTPVIGGSCRLGTTDVQIGGKQTQFFLKCEATSDSPAGDGVWVVKSRAAAAAAAPSTGTNGGSSSASIPLENTQPQQHPKLMRKQNAPNICEQDNDAREADNCAVSATCLQASQDIPSSYLQCDQTSLRWIRKSCQDGFIFNFEQQTCVVPKRMSSLSHELPFACPDGSGPIGICPCVLGTFCTTQHFCCRLSSLLFKPYNYLPLLSKPRRHPTSHREDRSDRTDRASGYDKAMTFASTSLVPMTFADGTCAVMSASCQDSSDCPPTFACKNNCCRMEKCPGGSKVLFTCTNAYQCRAGEKCLFGGCCPQMQKGPISKLDTKKVELTAVSVDLAVKGDDDPYNNLETMFTRSQSLVDSAYSAVVAKEKAKEKEKEKVTQMPSAMPVDECDLDKRVEDCSLSNPCPEDSECLSGQCCSIKAKRCKNGFLSLSVPKTCKFSDECPISSYCERNVCCPIAGDRLKSKMSQMDNSADLPPATTPASKKRSDRKSVV